MLPLSRRKFVISSGAASGTIWLTGLLPTRLFAAPQSNTPHFFINILYRGGMDHSYLFDARPEAFTAAGLVQNYLLDPNFRTGNQAIQNLKGKAPIEYAPRNGGKSWRSPLTDTLVAGHGDDLAIINGIHMLNNDGHDDNQEHFLTGTEQGKEIYAAKLSGSSRQDIFNYLISGRSNDFRNAALGLQLNPESFAKLLAQLPQTPLATPVEKFLVQQYLSNQEYSDGGSFSIGSAKLHQAALKSESVMAELRNRGQNSQGNTGRSIVNQNDIMPILSTILQAFRMGFSSTAIIAIDALSVDNHRDGPDGPVAQGEIIAQINDVLTYLKGQEYLPGSGKRFFDVTTVMFGSEFNRTFRQLNEGSIFNVGTDHNPYANSIILAGKGIKGAQVVGASDLDRLEADVRIARGNSMYGSFRNNIKFAGVSKHHMDSDSELRMFVGKPFDFNTAKVKEPGQGDEYIRMSNVVQTLEYIYGVRNNTAGVLTSLIKNA